MNTIIERKTSDNIKEEFGFWFDDRRKTLYLDVYRLLRRETSRHKFQTVKQYSRLDSRTPPYNWIKLDEVPLTDDIKKLALEKFVSEVKVDMWKDA